MNPYRVFIYSNGELGLWYADIPTGYIQKVRVAGSGIVDGTYYVKSIVISDSGNNMVVLRTNFDAETQAAFNMGPYPRETNDISTTFIYGTSVPPIIHVSGGTVVSRPNSNAPDVDSEDGSMANKSDLSERMPLIIGIALILFGIYLSLK